MSMKINFDNGQWINAKECSKEFIEDVIEKLTKRKTGLVSIISNNESYLVNPRNITYVEIIDNK